MSEYLEKYKIPEGDRSFWSIVIDSSSILQVTPNVRAYSLNKTALTIKFPNNLVCIVMEDSVPSEIYVLE